MSRRSDYVRNRPVSGPGPFEDPYDDPSYLSFDRHSNDPRHKRTGPENVSYGDRLPRNQSDLFMSERTDSRLSERCSRGYNPPYYGTPSSIAGSDPGRDDYGFEFEDPETARYTPMGDGYSEYKKLGEQSERLASGYSQGLKAIGRRPPRKQQREEYYGSPSMTREHHCEMHGIASSAADAAFQHREARSQFDQDYRHHYKTPQDRAGHLEKVGNERNREEEFRKKERSHQQWL